MKLVWINSSIIKKGYRYIKTKFGEKGVEETKTAQPFGFDSNPPKGYMAIVADTMNNNEPVVVGYLDSKALDSLAIGEVQAYAVGSNGNRVATITYRKDGTIEMLGVGDFMVRYSGLKTAYDELNDKFNSLVDAFNQHMHATAAVGPPVIPTPILNIIPAIQSTGDITGSKIDEIKTI